MNQSLHDCDLCVQMCECVFSGGICNVEEEETTSKI